MFSNLKVYLNEEFQSYFESFFYYSMMPNVTYEVEVNLYLGEKF